MTAVGAVPHKSDLGVRTASAIVMLAIAGLAIWLGGWAFRALVIAVGLGVQWEFWGLARSLSKAGIGRLLWMAGGLLYIAGACLALLWMGAREALWPIAIVIGTDIGAYFTGRTIGGPKIAPAISPSKTWSGLLGGMAGAAMVGVALAWIRVGPDGLVIQAVAVMAAVLAVAAQAGDFFESWMKRRAGVKDSSALIPGHGGLFDRVDGLLPVALLTGILAYWGQGV